MSSFGVEEKRLRRCYSRFNSRNSKTLVDMKTLAFQPSFCYEMETRKRTKD
jgi:hypothetical protein